MVVMAVALVHFSGGMPRQFHAHFLGYPLVGQNGTEGVPQGVESSAGKIPRSLPLHDLEIQARTHDDAFESFRQPVVPGLFLFCQGPAQRAKGARLR